MLSFSNDFGKFFLHCSREGKKQDHLLIYFSNITCSEIFTTQNSGKKLCFLKNNKKVFEKNTAVTGTKTLLQLKFGSIMRNLQEYIYR